jgi:hypothetical protein
LPARGRGRAVHLRHGMQIEAPSLLQMHATVSG